MCLYSLGLVAANIWRGLPRPSSEDSAAHFSKRAPPVLSHHFLTQPQVAPTSPLTMLPQSSARLDEVLTEAWAQQAYLTRQTLP
jgi:hypothetical protein